MPIGGVRGMEIIRKKTEGIRRFIGEVVAEMKKSVWPGKQELIESTFVVIVSVLLMSVFVGASDKLLITLLKLLIPSG